MTLLDLASYACRTTGDISSEALQYAKDAVRLKYDTLYITHNWRESQRVIEKTLDLNLNGVVFLPYDAEEVIFLSLSYDAQSYIRLIYRERDWIERFATPAFTLPGNRPWFYRAENLAWPQLNPGHMTFTSTNKSPFTVHIEGRDQNDFPQAESFILQGVLNPDGTVSPSSISSANVYKSITVLSKDVTDVALLVSDEVSSGPVQMPAGMTELVFTQIVLAPPPLFYASDGTPLNISVRAQVKLKADTLDNDYSVPRISSVWDALVCFTSGSLYRRLQQIGKAQQQEQEAMQHVQAAVNKEKNQAEWRQQAVPVLYESGDYLSGGYANVSSTSPFG
jgi:hypothetical protein